MSPSPALPLEVERYIGACLISNHNHQKTKQQQQQVEPFYRERYHRQRTFSNDNNYRPQRCPNLDGWAGGMPLISFVPNRPRRLEQPLVRTPPPGYEDFNLARLAVHTQGAPLILSKTYNHRKNKLQRNQNATGKPRNGENKPADTVSVTSDESYGSVSSEQCLPRIIKPRKRRKKDRKTPSFEPPSFQSSDSTEVSSDGTSPEAVNPSRLTFEFLLESETPRLHHTFDEVEDLEEDSKVANATSCQCRYCDPAGQIWDSDKTHYSSFLTPPDRPDDAFPYPDLSRLTLEEAMPRRASASDLEVSTQIVTSLNGLRDLEIKFFSSASASCDDKVYHRKDVVETC
ncbi:uncharacterized protein LOC123319299 [Coccinella septempunctata]|uniref:uncharacterized protein LOC123319299 n=1 Tax=Coccinella septempunctata TaxID=41139 RepID=UPI001D07DCAF|nr:uncharacterized protein LOC123319299 [Coccinella septempunctata]